MTKNEQPITPDLDRIGFYTLSNKRAMSASSVSPLWRGELLLTDHCNLSCVYCRGIKESFKPECTKQQALSILELWFESGLKNVRFSGGEPTLYKDLALLVSICRENKVEHIAISTNGTASWEVYQKLIDAGVNDFSVSLDACCSATCQFMSGSSQYSLDQVALNIMKMAHAVYTTVGIVVTRDNASQLQDTTQRACNLGAHDIRVIASSHENLPISVLTLRTQRRLPIFEYRMKNLAQKRNLRGLDNSDNQLCPLVLDDVAATSKYHFPCIIYLRERGKPIGLHSKEFRQQRKRWFKTHNVYEDPICRKNCLDVCVDYNNAWRQFALLPERIDGQNLTLSSWKNSSLHELGLYAHSLSLCTERAKRIIRERTVGYCSGNETKIRPKSNCMAVVLRLEDDEVFWTHLLKEEWNYIFPELPA